MAFGKLQGFITGAPITYPGQNFTNIGMFFGRAWCADLGDRDPQPVHASLFYAIGRVGFVLGVLVVLPIGGADMPVVISLLNSYAGLAACATGFALEQQGPDHRRRARRHLGPPALA